MQDAIIFAASTASSAVFILENEIRTELLASSAVRPIAVSTWLGSASWLRQAESGRDTDVLSVKHQEQSLPINAGKAQVQRLPWIENGRAVGADNISAPTLF